MMMMTTFTEILPPLKILPNPNLMKPLMKVLMRKQMRRQMRKKVVRKMPRKEKVKKEKKKRKVDILITGEIGLMKKLRIQLDLKQLKMHMIIQFTMIWSRDF